MQRNSPETHQRNSVEIIIKNRILELKKTMSKIKNTIETINSKVKQMKESFNLNISYLKLHKGEGTKGNKESLLDL